MKSAKKAWVIIPLRPVTKQACDCDCDCIPPCPPDCC